MKRLLILFPAIVLFFSACEKNAPVEGNGVKTPKQLSFSTSDEQLLYRTNEFSFNLLSQVSGSEEMPNVILSPLSASMLLGMVMNGADGETLQEMQEALGFEGFTQEQINAYYKQLAEKLPALDTQTIVKIANSLWIDNTFPVKQDFVEVNRESFNATSRNVDMADGGTADIINRWAADNTNNLIKKVVSANDIKDCAMILANALYFKGIWEDEFKESKTRERQFTMFDGATKNVKMMHRSAYYRYAKSDDVQWLELPYKGGQYCMDIVLPEQGNNIKDVVKDLTAESWNELLAQSYFPEVNLALPKFTLRYNRTLTDDLRAIGIERALSRQAQFPFISDVSTYLAWVKQCCYLAVDEKGTEAAAVTVGGLAATSAGPESIINFVVDRPFLVVIREKTYGTILFTAIVGDPTAE